MSHDSYRNKKLVEFPNGKMMLLCEVSCSNVSDAYGRRVWDWALHHPKDTLYYTKETLAQQREDYVKNQLEMLRSFNQWEIENGFATEVKEPTLESYDYYGTVYPGGSRVKNGKAFYGGRPIKAQEFFEKWDSPKRITFICYDSHTFERTYEETYDLVRADLDDCYKDAIEQNKGKGVYFNIR